MNKTQNSNAKLKIKFSYNEYINIHALDINTLM